MTNKAYEKGARGEWDVRSILIDQGIQAVRAMGSIGRDMEIGGEFWASIRRGQNVPAFLYRFGDGPTEGGWYYMGPLNILWEDVDFKPIIANPPIYIKRELRTHEALIARKDRRDWRIIIRKEAYKKFKRNNPVLP